MKKPIPYKYANEDENEGMSLKEKVVYTLLGAAGLTGLAIIIKKTITKKVENKAHEKSFEDGTPQTIAKQIKMAFENDGEWGTDIVALRKILTDIKSKSQMKRVYDEYENEYHRNLYKDLADELQTSEYNEMLQIISAKPIKEGQAPTTNQFTAWAKRLKAAFDKTYSFIPGTDENAIKAVFTEIPTQTAFIQVGKAYYKEYGDNLITVLKSELEVWEYGDYMKIITSKRKA